MKRAETCWGWKKAGVSFMRLWEPAAAFCKVHEGFVGSSKHLIVPSWRTESHATAFPSDQMGWHGLS